MKTFFLRTAFFLIGAVGIFLAPWVTLVCGAFLFSLYFKNPLEILILGLAFEFLSGIPPGTVILPLAFTIALQNELKDRLDADSFIAIVILLAVSIFVFISIRALFLLILFGYPGVLAWQFFTLF
ncbi:MAG: hypothetical protein COU47_00095 [Candidatus Niyogibacteria bacterium CG10_big_fil_rev_8_21_14_0_10_46_36]|uniref:Uncharacterized protein n=1 Tax=Candidatus Niyogibacteria bacterium CG10_big_fil_rev_8_21_14_0_10_46_36 TaxID=1974726 RepID=A0A2H0TE51_9BACT|nr:MAG: hypothetical protein COU47_00095 [Candidatus Niyogibacteria bacterium CG10_big_fil_rev_8_21_14_0_10_46_36]